MTMQQLMVARDATPQPPPTPGEFADYAFEFKLGFDAGVDANAVCPIKNSHIDPAIRRQAWLAGWKARRKALGKPQMRPLNVMGFRSAAR